MASSIASYIVLNKDLNTGREVITEVPLQNCEIYIPKQTSVDKIGGILCYVCDSKFVNKKAFDCHFRTHNTKDIVYTCVACRKQHSGYPSFRNHCYLQHVVKNKFTCQQCTKTFSKQSILDSHIKTVHDFKCRECDEQFKSKKDLQIHKIIHNKKDKDNPPYNCIKCSQVIVSIDMCETHIDDHCEILHPCPICATVLPNKHEATLHLTEHFDEKITPELEKLCGSIANSSIDILGGILCCHCDLLFKNRSEIVSHFTSEHEDKVIVYSCNICEKQYTKYSLFGDHCYSHISKDKYKCEECNRLFPRLSLLVMHSLVFHSEGAVDKPYSCDQCIYGFKSHYRLLEHKRLVHNDVTIKCHYPKCSATFNTPSELISHQREHRSSLENWCRQCGLQFGTLHACAKHLDAHRRTLFTCPVCSRHYAERYLLVKHLPTHFESVLHICKVCGRSYSARCRLIAHAKSHSEAKKYKCTYCTKSFSRPHEVIQHERIHTGVKPYRCTVCFKNFACYPNWSKHLSRAHAFDKNMIKNVREATKQSADGAKSSPVKAESGIESAGSEISDLCNFMESDDSDTSSSANKIKREGNTETNEKASIVEPGYSIEASSIKDTVNAAIKCIDEDLLLLPSTSFPDLDDSSDIKAIVEHIDALSSGLNIEHSGDGDTEMLQFTEMMPVENIAYNHVAEFSQPEPQYTYQATSAPLEYGPDFTSLGSQVYTDSLNEHVLPHIDPLLTLKAEQTIFVQNVHNLRTNDTVAYDQNWQPILTKISYDETNDKKLYVLNSNMF